MGEQGPSTPNTAAGGLAERPWAAAGAHVGDVLGEEGPCPPPNLEPGPCWAEAGELVPLFEGVAACGGQEAPGPALA